MTTPISDPRPAATEAARDEATRQAVQDAIENSIESLIDATVETTRFLGCLAKDGYTVVPAAVPTFGQVCVSAIAAQRAMDAIKDSVAMMTNLRDGDVDEKLQRVFDEQYEAYEEFDAALKGAAPMTQPQPTAADDLDDARDVIAKTVVDCHKFPGALEDEYDWAHAILSDLDAAGYRLARAESAPGVTIPTDIAIYAQTILGDMGPDEVDGDSWPTHVATVRILGDAIDAALADADPQR